MEKKTNEISDRGRKWLDTLEQDSEGRYAVQEDYARKCDEATSDLLRLMDAHDIGNTKIVVVDGDTSGVVSLGALNAVFMAAFGSSHLLVGGGHEPLYDILTKSVDLLMNAKIIARCVLGEVEKAGADRAIISDARKAILGEDE